MPSAHIPPRRTRGALLVLLLAGTALGGFAVGHVGRASPSDTAGVIQPSMPQRMPDFADLAAQVRPAVVSITSRIEATADSEEMSMLGGIPGGPPRMGEARGSGFIIDANGTIVTNNHVVRNAQSVRVTLDDGTELPAKVVGHDARTDIAVLKVDAKGKLPFLQLGDSSVLRPGEWVVAMGNPFGLGGSVTAGIVSALGRDIGAGPYDQFIQIDAPINQGNSGGPLFNQRGQVVGINTAILSPSGGSVGIGFAIPANLVKTVVAQLDTTGHVARGFIGLRAQTIAPDLAQALKLPATTGALVASVEPDSPAAKAGIQPGDVVRAVNDHKVATPRDLALAVAAVHPGDTLRLDVQRDGSDRTISVAAAQQPGEQTADTGNAAPDDNRPRIGVALAPAAADPGNRVDGRTGAMVAAVQPDSPADRAGLRPGDLITNVGAKAVHGPEDAAKAIGAAASGKAVALRVVRDGQAMFLAVKPATQGEARG